MKSGIISYTTLPPIKCQSNYVRPLPLFCASVTRLMCSSCGTNTRSICLSIICATTSKQRLGTWHYMASMQPLNNTDCHVLQSIFPCQLEMPLKHNLTIKTKKERKPNKEYHP
ncbi:hypothetical protein AVEN_125440-1 [Araneus ventricosus]|uniref:Uncharacterized protein n=1 Tax=Araneus ventricosus TaxID=182803 RepID=A0A4Y2M932_ARAVE|nr:hypothetical protein AVEN_125440-1 [Araneus ventricosus]